ncbi:MAG: sensor histidine kinase [Cytophagales bacterium]|nr:MAG: sensor histidine kinase [Cytophagales bacterium]
MINIYERNPAVNWVILGLALLIGLTSIIYTNMLVNRILEQEEKQIALFAKGQEFLATAEPSENLTFLMEEIVGSNTSIPVILTDENRLPIGSRNLDEPKDPQEKEAFLLRKMKEMQEENPPIVFTLDSISNMHQYVYYENSTLVNQLRYFPYVQLTVILLFFALVYALFSYSRKAEQNQVWVGLAKETAHQLGTPLSSLIAWVEYLRLDDAIDAEIVEELEKDVKRFETITARFSSIGSTPTLKQEDIKEVLEESINYLQKRVSSKVHFLLHIKEDELLVPMNKSLFEWVIENICKNAVDAMNAVGSIDIYVSHTRDEKGLVIDIKDSGKGIHKSKLKTVFKPGFTTKKRGWGLGLALAKRIVENYHKGKIFVFRSEIDIGTTFRIILPKG